VGVALSLDPNGVADLELDWPDRRNALGPLQAVEMTAAIDNAVDGGARTIVLSSSGRAFCAGGDLPAIVEMVELGADAVRTELYAAFQGLFRTIADSPVPILAAVDGAAVGLGTDLALACGVTFIGEHGWLRQGWASLGLIPAPGGVEYVRRRGGSSALWRFVTSDRVDGEGAEALGLGVSVTDARAAARSMAADIAALPDGVAPAMQELLRHHELSDHLQVALDLQVGFLTSEAFRERAAGALGRTAGPPQGP
jgi:enoyl-CoA hydratase/carnithine racemase